jgi:hypothetical protein
LTINPTIKSLSFFINTLPNDIIQCCVGGIKKNIFKQALRNFITILLGCLSIGRKGWRYQIRQLFSTGIFDFAYVQFKSAIFFVHVSGKSKITCRTIPRLAEFRIQWELVHELIHPAFDF